MCSAQREHYQTCKFSDLDGFVEVKVMHRCLLLLNQLCLAFSSEQFEHLDKRLPKVAHQRTDCLIDEGETHLKMSYSFVCACLDKLKCVVRHFKDFEWFCTADRFNGLKL